MKNKAYKGSYFYIVMIAGITVYFTYGLVQVNRGFYDSYLLQSDALFRFKHGVSWFLIYWYLGVLLSLTTCLLLLLYVIQSKVIKPLILRNLLEYGEDSMIIRPSILKAVTIKYVDIVLIEVKTCFLQKHLLIEVNNDKEYKDTNFIIKKLLKLPKDKTIILLNLAIIKTKKNIIESDAKSFIDS